MHENICKIIKDSTQPILLITNDIVKKDILTQLNDGLYNLSIMSLPTFMQKLTFTYEEEAIYFLMKEFEVNYDIALTYLQNLNIFNYVSNDDNQKLILLQKIYQFLDAKRLIIKDEYFLNYCKNKKIIVYGYSDLTKEEEYILKKVDHTLIELAYDKKITPKVLKCESFKDELFYTMEAICDLLAKGIPLCDIKLVGINSDQFFYTKQVFKMYQIPLNLNEMESLYSYDIAKLILNDNSKIKEDNLFTDEVVRIMNKFARIPMDDTLKTLLINSFKNTFVSLPVNDNAISLIDVKEVLYLENKYVFILGFNQGKIPIIYKDEDFFDDAFKTKFGLTTTTDLNKSIKELLVKVLKSNNQIQLSYTTKESPSPLIYELNLQIEDLPNTYYSKYAPLFNQQLLVSYLDTYRKYGTKTKVLQSLVKTYQIPYLEYQNTFTGINYQIPDKKLTLSYSAIDNYYKCSFMYYVQRVLKLDSFTDNFTTFIGSLYHKILSLAFNDNFDFEKEFEQFIDSSAYKLNNKELFLITKLKKELLTIIEILREQAHYINYHDVLFEKNVRVKINNPDYSDYDLNFVGFIDKIYYKSITDEDGNVATYISIVDYKTGKLDIKLDLVPYGLSLQLPVYLYLARHSDLVNVKVYGFFLQIILQNEIKAATEEEYLDLKKKALMLNGYIVDNVASEAEFDNSKVSSNIIKSLKIKNDGTYYKYSKVLTKEKIDELIKIVEEKIINASSDIIKGKFDINPKLKNGVNISCDYCRFSDLCYKNYKDFIHIEVGEDNDQMD